MGRYRWILAVSLLMGGAVQAATPSLAMLAEGAAKRFPQEIRAGALVGRDVLKPVEAQPILGRVRAVTRRGDGGFDVVMTEGGFYGFGGREVAVPMEAVALLGEHLALVGLTPEELAGLPSANTVGAVAGDTVVRVGLVKPFH